MPTLECDVGAAREALEAAGASFSSGNTEYERWHATLDDANAVAYDGKVVVQGKRPADIEAVLRGALDGLSDGGGGGPEGAVECYFDGASRGNPGPAAVGWVIADGNSIVAEGGERIGRTTNNQAEYEALIQVLRMASKYGYSAVEVKGDSQLIVRQIRGEYDTNDPGLREKRVDAMSLLSEFDEWSIQHVPREINDRADELANEALDDG